MKLQKHSTKNVKWTGKMSLVKVAFYSNENVKYVIGFFVTIIFYLNLRLALLKSLISNLHEDMKKIFSLYLLLCV